MSIIRLLLPVFALVPVLCTSNQYFETTPQGTVITIQGIKTLFIQGTHYERGFQHGTLLGNNIMQVFTGFLIAAVCSSQVAVYDSAHEVLMKHLVYDTVFRDEARGVIAGMRSAGVSLYEPTLKRDIDTSDILAFSSIEEFFNVLKMRLGCSSISSWGPSTKNDPSLTGELIITRHWDYFPIKVMVDNLLMIVHKPSEADEQPWVSLAWAGMIGSCSAMNRNGIGAFLDYGPDFFMPEEFPNFSFHRAFAFSIRAGIEKKNYDGIGATAPDDVLASCKEYPAFFGCMVHIVTAAGAQTPACILESNNVRGFSVRTSADNDAVIPENNLALTNHFRKLYPALDCWRYTRISDSLKASAAITRDRSWDLLGGAGGVADNWISVSYVPATGSIRCSFSSMDSVTVPAYQKSSGYFTIDSLMALFP